MYPYLNNGLKEIGGISANPKTSCAWYSGRSELPKEMIAHFDYIKIDPYIKDKGPLNSKTTNQRLYLIKRESSDRYLAEDITALFQKKEF